MNRKQMVEEMEWLTPDSGTGFGICQVAGMMSWAMAEPSEGRPDLKSVVAVKGNPKIYTDDEIEALYSFSKRRTTFYDEMFRYRLGANLIIIGKEKWGNGTTKWLRKRMSWDMGNMYSDTLEEALAIFDDGVKAA